MKRLVAGVAAIALALGLATVAQAADRGHGQQRGGGEHRASQSHARSESARSSSARRDTGRASQPRAAAPRSGARDNGFANRRPAARPATQSARRDGAGPRGNRSAGTERSPRTEPRAVGPRGNRPAGTQLGQPGQTNRRDVAPPQTPQLASRDDRRRSGDRGARTNTDRSPPSSGSDARNRDDRANTGGNRNDRGFNGGRNRDDRANTGGNRTDRGFNGSGNRDDRAFNGDRDRTDRAFNGSRNRNDRNAGRNDRRRDDDHRNGSYRSGRNDGRAHAHNWRAEPHYGSQVRYGSHHYRARRVWRSRGVPYSYSSYFYWGVGSYYPYDYRSYVVVDFWDYYLPPPPRYHVWVRHGDCAYLVAIATGLIVALAIDDAYYY